MTVIELLSNSLFVGLIAILIASSVMGLFSSNKHFPVEGRVSLSQPFGLMYTC
jgi:3-dehydrosphinganine reductase